ARSGLCVSLGLPHHPKTPSTAVRSVARSARHAVISTRVVRFNLPPGMSGAWELNRDRVELHTVPVAYLVDDHESNNDSTNYWMFSDAGLRRILQRTGWDVLDYMTVGNDRSSEPATDDGDERALCLVRSRNF